MEEYMRNLKSQIKSLRKQIAKENRELQDISKSINDELVGASIENSVGFMKTNIDYLVKASAKLAQLESIYSALVHEGKCK